jgi:hypothetical protein
MSVSDEFDSKLSCGCCGCCYAQVHVAAMKLRMVQGSLLHMVQGSLLRQQPHMVLWFGCLPTAAAAAAAVVSAAVCRFMLLR